jgi:hypothetical protein
MPWIPSEGDGIHGTMRLLKAVATNARRPRRRNRRQAPNCSLAAQCAAVRHLQPSPSCSWRSRRRPAQPERGRGQPEREPPELGPEGSRGCRRRCDRRLLVGGRGLARAVGQDVGHRVVPGLGSPQAVPCLHRDLPGDVFAPEALVRRQPGGCVAVALFDVGGTVRRLEVQWVVGEGRPLLRCQLIASDAAVTVDVDPRLPEQGSVITRLGRPALDGKGRSPWWRTLAAPSEPLR